MQLGNGRQAGATRFAALVRLYYLAGTPVFWLVDVAWDAPARVSFVADPAVRRLYYVGCIAFGVIAWPKPRISWHLGLSESLVNFTLCILSIMVPVYSAYEQIPAGVQPTLDPMQPVNAGISGAFALYAFYSRMYGGWTSPSAGGSP